MRYKVVVNYACIQMTTLVFTNVLIQMFHKHIYLLHYYCCFRLHMFSK